MAYSGTDFPTVNPGEVRTVSFNFTTSLQGGETVSSVSWGMTALGGLDVYAQSHITEGTLSGAIATNVVSGLMGGIKYIIEALATTSAGNVYALYSHMLCQAPQ